MKKRLFSLAAGALIGAGLIAAAEQPKPAAAPSHAAAKPGPADEIPRGQKVQPGPALSPEDAMAKMELPPGFKIECIASEPLLINPTSFTFDDRGRIWVTESVEYPRREPGKGQDRIKILEDTDGDGKMDKATIFKDGLNIPAGIAIGNGGVYVTNSPDVLFLQDTDGDGKADKETTILTGFGRFDTHELPNSLTWGPDGWLYGMNGVFNPAKVKDPASGKEIEFTCGIWRYHPPTKRFELFAEGTSNPWGLDYNRQGEWFVSCCVIDHLFHITQSGYYHRQGGPYPPNVQIAKLPSICTERHQAAAYAGLCIYDADVFPEEYRGRLIMGNLHGSCLNQDLLSPNGSTYTQKNVKRADNPKENYDFLSGNDAWFMPVSEKIGPDGCLYVMDWYDRYHCYQDANRDSPGVDRSKGRIYRISYNGAAPAKPFDLTKMSDDELLKQFESPNVWRRRTAQRVLNERRHLATVPWLMAREPAPPVDRQPDLALYPKLESMALDPSLPNNANMHALWLLISQNALTDNFLMKVLSHSDATVRNWGVRAIGNAQHVSPAIYEKLTAMAADPSPQVRVQVAVAAGRLIGSDPLPVLLELLKDPANAHDPLIPSITYMNLLPLAAERGKEILAGLAAIPGVDQSFGGTTVRWIKQAIATSGKGAQEIVADVSRTLDKVADTKTAGAALGTLADGLGGLSIGDRAKAIPNELRERIQKYVESDDAAVRVPATEIALWWRDAKGVEAARQIIADPKAAIEARVALAKTLAESKAVGNTEAFAALAGDKDVPLRLRQVAIDSLGAIGRPEAAAAIIKLYASFPGDLKPGAINALTRSGPSAGVLLDAIESKEIPVADVTTNHARSILALNDKSLTGRLTKDWGTLKTDRDPERVKIVEKMRKVVEAGKGNAAAGWKTFEARCAQCHTIYGKGGNVGPDLTGVGREDLNAILTNVLDPNLVIGAPYYVNVAKTKDGDVVSGLLVESSDKQVVLKDQTKTVTIPRSNLEKLTVQNVSMMPEGLEAQMSDQDFRDLVAFLLTREPPK